MHPEGTRLLVLGVLGMGICPILAPYTWRRAGRVLAEIDASDVPVRNRPSVVGARICGVMGTVVWGTVALILVVLVVVGAIDALVG